MKKQNLLLVLEIIITGYIAGFLWNYIKFVQRPSFLSINYNECTALDLQLSHLFIVLFIFSLAFQTLTFFTKNQRVLKNYLIVSLNVFILLSIHNFLQVIFNNKSDILLEQPPLLISVVPLTPLLLVYWFTKNQNINQSVSHDPMRIFITTARITFFVVFFVSILATSFYHYHLVDKTFRAHGQFINEYNCGEYYPPSVIPPAKLL